MKSDAHRFCYSAGARSLFLFFVLFVALLPEAGAENLEKAQKKELESQAKALIAEAKGLEKAGQLAEARAKYTESQALIEINEATDAIKHLDDEIHKRIKNQLNESRKLYDASRFKETAAALDESSKLGAFQAVLSYNLALCYHRLGEREKALEHLQRAIDSTPDPKRKQKLQELLTFFVTGENANTVPEHVKSSISQVNLLTEGVGMDASLTDDQGEEKETAFSDPALVNVSQTSANASSPSKTRSYTAASHRTSLCNSLEELKGTLANSPSLVFDRANCAEDNGRPAEAVKLLQQYLELAPNALDAAHVRTRIAELQSLIALSGPNAPEARHLYTSAYGDLSERKHARALAAYTRASQLFPEFPLLHWKLALLQEAFGNTDEARAHFTRYQELATEQAAKDEANLHEALKQRAHCLPLSFPTTKNAMYNF